MGPKSGWGGPDRLCQTSPIPRSPDGDNKCEVVKQLWMSTLQQLILKEICSSRQTMHGNYNCDPSNNYMKIETLQNAYD